MDLVFHLAIVTVFLHCACEGSLEDEPFFPALNIDPNTPKTRGSKFFLGFMNNQAITSVQTTSELAIFVTCEQELCPFVVETKFAGVVGFQGFTATSPGSGLYSRNETARRGSFTVIRFPSGRLNPATRQIEPDIAVQDSGDRNRGIHVRATDPSHELTIYAMNEEHASTDGYMAMSCVSYPTARDYRYFVFSASFTVANLATRLSRFLIVPCEDDTQISIDGSQAIESPTDLRPSVIRTDPNIANWRIVTYRRLLDQFQTLMIDSPTDLTGTIIISDKPISVFTGHQCGQVPRGERTCDYLVEQIPPHTTYGSLFFTAPFATRKSGDLYRVGSVRDGVTGTVTCTQEGSCTPSVTPFSIGEGEYYQFTTTSGPNREFCYIQTNRPVTIMGYTLAHMLDNINLPGRPGPYGDPAMVYIPPATAYLNNYTITTANQLSTDFYGYISYVLPTRVFENSIADQSNFRINGTSFTPDSGYQPIYCSVNGGAEICAYGAYSEVNRGESTIQYGTGMKAFGLYTYGFTREQSYAYTAAFEVEPVGLAWIQGQDLVVLETAGTVTIPFHRVIGDVALRSRAFARTRDAFLGNALAGQDYTTINPGSTSNLRWRSGRENPVRNFTMAILDDDTAEPVEYLEVVLTCDGNENCYIPQSVYRITIVDDQGQCADLPAPVNGGIDYDFDPLPMRPYGTNATYTCVEGSMLVGQRYRICNNGGWSGTAPICQPNEDQCSALHEFLNGQIVYSVEGPDGIPNGAVATYSCYEGYELIGNPKRTCTLPVGATTGHFDGEEPHCDPVCQGLSDIENGIICYCDTIDKTGPEYDLGTVATYSCDTGYQLNTGSGNEMRTCEDGGPGVGGVFSGAAPTCDPILCPELQIVNGVITYGPDTRPDFDQGTVATYICNQGFELVQGDKQRICQNDGNFSGIAPICRMIPVCVNLPDISNGFITYNMEDTPHPLGTVATYECDSGYILRGEENRTCVEDSGVGVFDGVEPFCDPIQCEQLGLLENGSITYSPDTEQPYDLGTTAQHECDPGFRLVGPEARVCEDDGDGDEEGVFSGNITTCKEITCSDLPDIANGSITYNMAAPRPLNTTALYECDDGFKLEGESERHCLENDTFSGVAPVCSMIRSLLIQLRLKGVDRCQYWVENNGRQKLSTVDTTLVNNLEEKCKCGFSSTNILFSNFQCFEESEDAVTYRAEIRGTPLAEASQLVSFIEEWLAQGALILFGIVLVPVDDSCPVVVTTFADPECDSPNEDSGTLAAIVGGVTGGVITVLIVAVIIAVITITCYVRKRRTEVIHINRNRFAGGSIASRQESEYEDMDFYRKKITTHDEPYPLPSVQPPSPTYALPCLQPPSPPYAAILPLPPPEYDYAIATDSGSDKDMDYIRCRAYVPISRPELGYGAGFGASVAVLPPVQADSSV